MIPGPSKRTQCILQKCLSTLELRYSTNQHHISFHCLKMMAGLYTCRYEHDVVNFLDPVFRTPRLSAQPKRTERWDMDRLKENNVFCIECLQHQNYDVPQISIISHPSSWISRLDRMHVDMYMSSRIFWIRCSAQYVCYMVQRSEIDVKGVCIQLWTGFSGLPAASVPPTWIILTTRMNWTVKHRRFERVSTKWFSTPETWSGIVCYNFAWYMDQRTEVDVRCVRIHTSVALTFYDQSLGQTYFDDTYYCIYRMSPNRHKEKQKSSSTVKQAHRPAWLEYCYIVQEVLNSTAMLNPILLPWQDHHQLGYTIFKTSFCIPCIFVRICTSKEHRMSDSAME